MPPQSVEHRISQGSAAVYRFELTKDAISYTQSKTANNSAEVEFSELNEYIKESLSIKDSSNRTRLVSQMSF